MQGAGAARLSVLLAPPPTGVKERGYHINKGFGIAVHRHLAASNTMAGHKALIDEGCHLRSDSMTAVVGPLGKVPVLTWAAPRLVA